MNPPGVASATVRLRRLEPALRRALRGPCRMPPGATLLVAVSGGADSTALLVSLASVAREFGLTLHAAHLHHGLRGRDADADLRSVRELCEQFGLPLADARWDCAARMRRRGLTGEAGLRTLRREWLARVARATGAVAVATAHTADDQLETLLMRFGRGTGLTGIAGMRARRGAWLKPLLAVTRAEIEADLAAHGIGWREDATNAQPRYLRNRIRHIAVPALLEALGAPAGTAARRRAGLAQRAGALAAELAQVERTLARAAARALDRARRPDGERLVFDGGRLARLSPVLQRLALRRAWRLATGSRAPGLTERHLSMCMSVLASSAVRRPGSTSLPGGWTLSADTGSVRFAPPSAGIRGSGRALRRIGPADARLHGARRRARPGPRAERPARARARRVIA